MSTWYERGIFYHMYPLGMCNAPKENQGKTVENRLEALEKWIPYLKDFGFNAIYIGPLFESSSHGYDTMDYRLVDRRLGDNQQFRDFVAQCHLADIKVVVDGVFNHTGRGFFAFQDIIENKGGSSYLDWYRGINIGGSSPYGDGFGYEAWQGHAELPVLNLKNPVVIQYIKDTVSFWVTEFDIDGIRLDCANVLDFDFMKQLRSHCEQIKEEFWLMGEVIHGIYSQWANADMLHSVTNYELHKGLYSGHNDFNCFEIAHTVRRQLNETSKGLHLYNFVDNHDEDRIAGKLHLKDHLFTVYTMLFTLPGIPSVYYGSEWGIEGKRTDHSDFALRPALTVEDAKSSANALAEHIRKLIQVHRENEAFHGLEYKELLLTNRQYAYLRSLGDSHVIIAVNIDEQPAQIRVPAAAKQGIGLLDPQDITIQNNQLELVLQPFESKAIALQI